LRRARRQGDEGEREEEPARTTCALPIHRGRPPTCGREAMCGEEGCPPNLDSRVPICLNVPSRRLRLEEDPVPLVPELREEVPFRPGRTGEGEPVRVGTR